MLESITVNDLKKLYNIEIIDLRSNEKYNDNHIPNAHNIPFDKILLFPDKYLDKQKKYYVYCQKGLQSKQLCRSLNIKGFKTVHIIGGYEAWILSE